jgi:hypothetical protein
MIALGMICEKKGRHLRSCHFDAGFPTHGKFCHAVAACTFSLRAIVCPDALLLVSKKGGRGLKEVEV